MPTVDTPKPTFSRANRWWIGLNTALLILGALALLVMVNYLADGYFKTFHWSRSATSRLSPQTLAVLDSLTNDVEVTIFFRPNGNNEQIYGLTQELLAQYARTCSHIHVRTLDYTRFVGEAKEVLSRIDMGSMQEKDFVLFEANGHSKLIPARALADYDFSDLLAQRSKYVRRSHFRGEMYFTGDIYAVSFPQTLKAYFLSGHGENDPGAGGDDKSKLDSKLASILTNQVNCAWERLSLQGSNAIPADCQLLIIAGPREGTFLQEERDKIAAYLIQGGRLLALLPENCGLEPVLRKWNVQMVGDDRVTETDPGHVDGLNFFAGQLIPHPVIDPLASEGLSIRMVPTRPVYRMEGEKVPGGPEVRYLATTTTNGGMDLVHKQRGEYGLLVAVEQGIGKGVSSSRGGGTRMIVAGDAAFLGDQVIDTYAGNELFAWKALDWLLERPQILMTGLGPQPIKEYEFYMTTAQSRMVQLALLGGMPGAVLVLGALVWLRRRV